MLFVKIPRFNPVFPLSFAMMTGMYAYIIPEPKLKMKHGLVAPSVIPELQYLASVFRAHFNQAQKIINIYLLCDNYH